MKLTIAKDELAKALQAVLNVVSSKSTLPVLSNVLLNADEETLDVTATDLDVTVTATVEAAIDRSGSLTVPAKRFFAIARELQPGDIEVEADDDGVCSLRAGSSFYKIKGLPAEDYPPFPEMSEEPTLTLPQVTVKAMLKRTSFAVSTDETRYVLNGIHVSVKDHKVTMVATDGRRLAFTDEEVELSDDISVDLIIPTKAITELSRLLHEEGEVEIQAGANQAAFSMKNEGKRTARLITKLVDGSYPNYKQVIPAEPGDRITLVKEEFLQALRRAEIMTSDKANSVKLTFMRNRLAITANTPDIGEGNESLAINYKGKEMNIAFNPAFLMDPLKALDGDEIYFELIDEVSPGVIKVNDPFLYVIIPMRTN